MTSRDIGQILASIRSQGRDEPKGNDLPKIEIQNSVYEIEEERIEYINFDAFVPVCEFGWSDRDNDDSVGHIVTLSKEISSYLDLYSIPRSYELGTLDGQQVTVNCAHRQDDGNYQTAFLVREDSLRSYLTAKNLQLIWAVWGERQYSIKQSKRFNGSDRPEHTHGDIRFTAKYPLNRK